MEAFKDHPEEWAEFDKERLLADKHFKIYSSQFKVSMVLLKLSCGLAAIAFLLSITLTTYDDLNTIYYLLSVAAIGAFLAIRQKKKADKEWKICQNHMNRATQLMTQDMARLLAEDIYTLKTCHLNLVKK